MTSNNNSNNKYYELLFKDFGDVLRVKDLKKILPRTGKNKIYKLLQDNEIKSKRIGRDYYIPKIYVIDFFTKN